MRPSPRHWQLPGVHLSGAVRGELCDSDTPAIFLHGFGGSQRDWGGVWDQLDTGQAVLRYDLRDFGGSRAENAAPFSHGEDMLALMDAEGIGQADLIGISMGGSIAVQFALDHPDRVRRLVLISTGLMAWDWSPEWRALWRAITTLARAGDMDGAKALWAAHPLFESARATAEGEALLREGIARYSGVQWIADHQRSSLPDVDRLPFLACPTLLLSGEKDMPDFHLIADLIEGAVVDVRRVDVPRHGHMLVLEAPGICAEAIGAFLAGD